MALSVSQRAIIERARALGSGEQAVALTDEMCVYLIAVIVEDLGLMKSFPEFKGTATPFFTATPLRDLQIKDVDFMALYERLLGLNTDADTLTIERTPKAEAASDEDVMPEDVTDQLPES